MIKVLELFAGIGACSKALERLKIDHEIVDAVEIDKYAVKSFNAIHGTNFEPQDITTWDKDIECDLIMHGSPCQDFSVAGKGAGGDEGSGTRSSLMYETLRIVDKLKPKYVIWENVKNLLSQKHRHNFDAYQQAMKDLGYTNYYQVLNAKNYGVPQNRERVFTISIRTDLNRSFVFPEPIPLERRLKDVLDTKVDEKYYLSDKALACFMSDGTGKYPRRERFLQNINRKNQDIGNSVTTRAGGRPTDNFVKEPVIVDDIYKNRDPRVYDKSPTLRAHHAGDLKVVEPFVVASRGRNPENPSDRTTGAPTEQRLEPKFDGTTNTITTVQKDNYVVVRTANSKGYDLATDGDGVDLAYPKSNTRRGRVGHGIAKTIMTSDSMGVVEKTTLKADLCNKLVDEGIVKGGEIVNHSYTNSKQRDTLDKYVETKNGITPTLTTRPDILGYVENAPLRIRKLTPKECWRLMGFDDTDFEKAEKVNSNAQLYKQAGNSIVVNVLEAILKELLDGSTD